MPAVYFRSIPSIGASMAGVKGPEFSPDMMRFIACLRASGYEPVSTTVLLEADLAVPEPRDPRAPLIRRQTQIEVFDDALPSHWWQNLALGDFELMTVRLLMKDDGIPVARAQAWDMGWFGREDERTRIGLINLEVPPQYRRKGLRALPRQ